MNDYKEFQLGWWVFLFVVPLQIFMLYAFASGFGNSPLDLKGYVIVSGTFFLILILFFGMTTTITDEKVIIKYGFGVISRNIKLATIDHVTTVKTPWYYGIGIRLIPNGWLYSINGFDAVELKFNDRISVIRIGTKDPDQLKTEIDKRLKKYEG